jgi:MinD superfamily P-loop ATPase
MPDKHHNLKQLVILSGKGGTGKTSIAAAFAHLCSQNSSTSPSVFVDADVDAANLGIVLQPGGSQSNEFWGGSLAKIDPDACVGCGDCVSVCRYDAILPDKIHRHAFWIDPIACDGCSACMYRCTASAITMIPQQEGFWFQSSTPYGALFHAELFPGRENSGKLVTLIRQHARLSAEDMHAKLIIIDGPPGIGCPVISACAGADLGLIVAEPGLSGLHDMDRILGTLQHFHVPAIIAINKADLYPHGTLQIQKYASGHDLPLAGEIPFDEAIPGAMLAGKPITEASPESCAARAIVSAWAYTFDVLMKE